jgi:diguanylate cyclase (GGDEF)-like protein
MSNITIPLVLAPPFFLLLLTKMRQLAIAQHELMNIAATDSLTSCFNRRAFTALVDGYLERIAAEKTRTKGALLVIDVDHFKAVNDQFGHDRGDEALQIIAESIKGAVRDVDLVGRLGGEEFGVFLPDLDPTMTTSLAERIREAINKAKFCPEGRRYGLSASIGGATFDRRANYSELYRLADQQLYSAKRRGRNRVEIQLPLPDPGTTLAASGITMH